MTFRVPYIPDDAVERDAEALLAQNARARGVEVKAPVPIEDIVEKHLKLRVEFDDLHRLLGVPRGGYGFEPDIFGAIWLETGEIVIDESLDPEERPAMEGAIVLPSVTRAADTGDCTVLSFKRMAIKTRSSATRGSRPLSADRAKPRSGWSCRRTYTLRAF